VQDPEITRTGLCLLNEERNNTTRSYSGQSVKLITPTCTALSALGKYNIIIYLLAAIGFLPGGSGYFTCKQNIELVTTRFKSGGLHEKHVVATWNLGKPSQLLLIDIGKPRKTCVEMAGRRTFRVLTSSQRSGILKKKEKEKKSDAHTVQQIHIR